MSAKDFKIVSVHVNAHGNPRPYRRERIQAMSFSSAESAPAVESGVSLLTVNVSGQVQLQH